MALRPCEVCFRHYRGPSSRAYIAIMDGGERWEHKPRLCPDDYENLAQHFEDVNGRIDYEATAEYEAQVCFVCHDDVSGKHPQSVFMTGYPARGDREDFFAPVCSGCRPGAERLLRGRTRG